MKHLMKLVGVSLLGLALLSGCGGAGASGENLFQYKDSYVGDNSAVGAILGMLPGGGQVQRFALETKTEPYGVTVELDEAMAGTAQARERTFLYDATVLLALVSNAEWVTFRSGSEERTVTRAEVQELYGVDVREVSTEAELHALVDARLGPEAGSE